LRRYILTNEFEQWIYENPIHTAGERTRYYQELEDRFNIGLDWKGLDIEKGLGWYKSQLLVIQPLYTISYALAQLGALAVYKHYRENKAKAIEQFENFLTIGFSKPIGKLYEAAGIRLDFTEDYIREIVVLVEEELKILE
jgi:oligoendopeptidase F